MRLLDGITTFKKSYTTKKQNNKQKRHNNNKLLSECTKKTKLQVKAVLAKKKKFHCIKLYIKRKNILKRTKSKKKINEFFKTEKNALTNFELIKNSAFYYLI